MEYQFRAIEKKWQEQWISEGVYRVSNDSDKPKYYILDMFPYPSGSGLHVGHPLGYIASDIYARYKRLKGFNVLHPMGYDAFGLPAEQYAIEHGVHPAKATEDNIATFRRQLDNIGFCYDWSREIRTCEPEYYKWTQWIFLELFNSFFDRRQKKARPIKELVRTFETEGNASHSCPGSRDLVFSAAEWNAMEETTRRDILMQYRLAYLDHAEVWWCEALGTVLANDEVINGVSERGSHPVIKKKMRQWFLRITEYADRLLEGLETVEFSDSMKDMQRNWIGKSYGAEIDFEIQNYKDKLKVYTTRPDTLFGVDFMVIAPEHALVSQITTPEQKNAVEDYLHYVQSRSDRERMSEVKQITGCFTGSYAVNPFDGKTIPIWIAEYVLIGYGTGAIMAVPCGDERDHAFARHFNIPITNIIGTFYDGSSANPTKEAILENSGFLNGMVMRDAIDIVIRELEKKGIGKRQTNFKMRDAGFSRQRYWGEPFPIIYQEEVAYSIQEEVIPAREGFRNLPLELPHMESYGPGPEGQGPLANLSDWVNVSLQAGDVSWQGIRETNTMPGYAGSSWYFLRYMDPENKEEFCSRKASDYWGQVDLYIGGTEHAVGHLLYSRMWTKVLYDLGHIGFDEPFRKLVNQGKIGGDSRLVYRVHGTHKFVSAGIREQYETDELHVDVNLVNGWELDMEGFRKWKPDFAQAEFILENGKYLCGSRLEKMSKRYFNVVNPDDVVIRYGADTFRMYEMFLGPIEQDKPWDTKGIEGVHRFLKKFWRLFSDETKGWLVNDQEPSLSEYKTLHRTIKKVEEDTGKFSFNTAVSAFMVCVNELQDQGCRKKKILEPLVILLAPFAPHVCEELWHNLGHTESVLNAAYPVWDEQYLVESVKNYPVSVNGKLRTQMDIALDATQEQVEALVMENEVVQKWMEGKQAKKIIYVKGKMVNIVV